MGVPMHGLVRLSLTEILPSVNNPRERLTDIDGLALSIAEQGLIQPIVVQRVPGGGYTIVAGHRRVLAVQRLGWTEIPALVRRDLLPDEELLAMVVENGQRAGLDPIEEAHAYQRLLDMGLTKNDVAIEIGRPLSHVAGRLMLLNLPREEQEELRAGATTLGRAETLVREQRRREREAASPVARPVGRPKGSRAKPYFGDTHPLAPVARRHCAGLGHGKGHVKVGGVACGPCWERVIRADQFRANPTDPTDLDLQEHAS
jgi:ParB family chromosome partitioning protein